MPSRLMRRNKTFKSQLRPAKPLIIDYSCDLVSRTRVRAPWRPVHRRTKPRHGTKGGIGMERPDKDSIVKWMERERGEGGGKCIEPLCTYLPGFLIGKFIAIKFDISFFLLRTHFVKIIQLSREINYHLFEISWVGKWIWIIYTLCIYIYKNFNSSFMKCKWFDLV